MADTLGDVLMSLLGAYVIFWDTHTAKKWSHYYDFLFRSSKQDAFKSAMCIFWLLFVEVILIIYM